jgi:IclR family transcriptional regulator, pca regulon regulatory protein
MACAFDISNAGWRREMDMQRKRRRERAATSAKRSHAPARRASRATGAAVPGETRIVDPRYVVPGLSRGLALLQLFTRSEPQRSLSDLAAGLGVSRSAAYRLVYTLENDGFLARDAETRRYHVTARVLSLGFEYLGSQAVVEIAQPTLLALSERTRAAAHVAVLDGWHSVYLSRVAPPVALVSNLQVGMRLPAHATASGRILIAQLDRSRQARMLEDLRRECRVVPPPRSLAALHRVAETDRKCGYVYHGSAFDPGVISVAAPVRDRSGAAVAAITVVGPKALFDELGGERALGPLTVEAAQEISHRLGYRGEHR